MHAEAATRGHLVGLEGSGALLAPNWSVLLRKTIGCRWIYDDTISRNLPRAWQSERPACTRRASTEVER